VNNMTPLSDPGWNSPLLKQMWQTLSADTTRPHITEFSLFCILDMYPDYENKEFYATDVHRILQRTDFSVRDHAPINDEMCEDA
jgi:hypothetical protein